MNFFKFFKKYFFKKNKTKAGSNVFTDKENLNSEINLDLDTEAVKENRSVEENQTKPKFLKDNIQKTVKNDIVPKPKPKRRKKRKKVKVDLEKKVRKIPKIDDNQDLYELFTGLKNENVREYIPKEKDYELSDVKFSGSKFVNPQKTVDLHHCTSKEAEKIIEMEVITARSSGIKAVQFITGKGLHSKNQESILKEVAQQKASDLKKKGKIRSFKWEKKQKRKSGAIIYYI